MNRLQLLGGGMKCEARIRFLPWPFQLSLSSLVFPSPTIHSFPALLLSLFFYFFRHLILFPSFLSLFPPLHKDMNSLLPGALGLAVQVVRPSSSRA